MSGPDLSQVREDLSALQGTLDAAVKVCNEEPTLEDLEEHLGEVLKQQRTLLGDAFQSIDAADPVVINSYLMQELYELESKFSTVSQLHHAMLARSPLVEAQAAAEIDAAMEQGELLAIRQQRFADTQAESALNAEAGVVAARVAGAATSTVSLQAVVQEVAGARAAAMPSAVGAAANMTATAIHKAHRGLARAAGVDAEYSGLAQEMSAHRSILAHPKQQWSQLEGSQQSFLPRAAPAALAAPTPRELIRDLSSQCQVDSDPQSGSKSTDAAFGEDDQLCRYHAVDREQEAIENQLRYLVAQLKMAAARAHGLADDGT